MVQMNYIDSNYISIEYLQKALIEKKYKGELSSDSIEVWWQILADWRRENERKSSEKQD